MSDLYHFLPFTLYNFVNIDEQTSQTIINDLIIQAKQTSKYTICSYRDPISSKIFLEIEFIQELQSIIIQFELADDSISFYVKIKQLLSNIFDSMHIIQTWGDITSILLDSTDHGYYLRDRLQKIHLFDIQEDFKIWYKRTFGHNENCDQKLDFLDIDGQLCTCSHRPYKCATDKWSLRMAIAYTFNENLTRTDDNLHECLAITKLSMVTNKKWSHQEVQTYIKEHHGNEKNR
jgi:hypothetical protein